MLQDYPNLTAQKIFRTRALMNRITPDALVTGYENRITTLTLPDAGDRHVLAAAIESKASAIVTFNLRHFAVTDLSPFGITAVHPDTFARSLYQAEPSDFLRAIHAHRANLTRPPKTATEYLAGLAHGQLPQTSAALAPHVAEI